MTATASQNEGSLPVPWRLILNRASREMFVIGIRDVVIRELPIVTHDVNFEEPFFSFKNRSWTGAFYMLDKHRR
jgi:hypothetical protein